jgi:hypothetical protein
MILVSDASGLKGNLTLAYGIQYWHMDAIQRELITKLIMDKKRGRD